MKLIDIKGPGREETTVDCYILMFASKDLVEPGCYKLFETAWKVVKVGDVESMKLLLVGHHEANKQL